MRKRQVKLTSRSILIVFICLLFCAADGYGQKLSEDFLKHFEYRSIGPTRQGGRITDIAVPDWKMQPYTFYVGCTGGLWKTSNYGNSFRPVFDSKIWQLAPHCVLNGHRATVFQLNHEISSLFQSANSHPLVQ